MNTELAIFASDLSVGYSSRTVAQNLQLHLKKGSLTCLLGANGCGKSTILKTLSGNLRPLHGKIELLGKELKSYHSSDLARTISIVSGLPDLSRIMTVYELVALGRTPYLSWTGKLEQADRTLIEEAMRMVDVEPWKNRSVQQLSDGERQRAMIARALAQDTEIILLDEPTAHLDLFNRMSLLYLLSDLAKKKNKGILVITHELELALKLADQVWLLDSAGKLSEGSPEDLILNGVLQQTFKSPGLAFDHSSGAFTFSKQPSSEISVEGSGKAFIWTKRAMKRVGCKIVPSAKIRLKIVEEKNISWIVDHEGQSHYAKTIEEVILQLSALKIL